MTAPRAGRGRRLRRAGRHSARTIFALDGGRTLQLGGTSTATGAVSGIDLNNINPNSGERSGLRDTDDCERGDVQRPDHQQRVEHLCPQSRRHRHRHHRGGEQPRHLHQERRSDDLDDLDPVQQQRHRQRAERDAEPVGRWHGCRGDLRGRRHDSIRRRHADAGCGIEHHGRTRIFSGGTTTTVNGRTSAPD